MLNVRWSSFDRIVSQVKGLVTKIFQGSTRDAKSLISFPSLAAFGLDRPLVPSHPLSSRIGHWRPWWSSSFRTYELELTDNRATGLWSKNSVLHVPVLSPDKWWGWQVKGHLNVIWGAHNARRYRWILIRIRDLTQPPQLRNRQTHRYTIHAHSSATQRSAAQLLFVNAGWVCGSYTADVSLRHYYLCPQNYFWVLIHRARKDGQLSLLLAFG